MMYKHFLLKTAAVTLLLLNGALISAQVTIGNNKEPETFSVLELISGTNKGLRLPQIENTKQRDLIFTDSQGFKGNDKALGLQIFNMCSGCVETWNGTDWISVCAPEPDCIMINGVCWAKSNVNAFRTFADYETDPGMLYQWNKPTAWLTTGTATDWNSDKAEGTIWATANDPCPNGFRVPIQKEFDSLVNYTKVTYEWTTEGGIKGGRFTDNASGNTTFLPAAGYRNTQGVITNTNTTGLYWCKDDLTASPTNSPTGGTTNARRLVFNNINAAIGETYTGADKKLGGSVRCVKACY